MPPGKKGKGATKAKRKAKLSKPETKTTPDATPSFQGVCPLTLSVLHGV
jgi:hypothetical protein